MTPYRQTVKHDPANGQYGDCARTCIASILDLPLESVPNFAESWKDNDQFWSHINAFLALHGMGMMSMAFNMDVADVLEIMEHHNENLYYMLGVGTPNGTDHFVVCRGGKIASDPAGYDDATLFRRDSTGNTWINVFTPLSVLHGSAMPQR
jgi:hypothetical protein